MIMKALRAAIFIVTVIFGVASCDELADVILPTSKPVCEARSVIENWAVSASLHKDSKGTDLFSYWQAAREFDNHFGVRIVYDTRESPTALFESLARLQEW